MIKNDRLILIPSDPLDAYEKVGILPHLLRDDYFNPKRAFKKVYVVSPYEPYGAREVGGYTIIGVKGWATLDVISHISPDLIRGYGGFWACDLAVYASALGAPGCPVYVSVHDPNPKNIHPTLVFPDRVHCTSSIVRDAVLRTGRDGAYTCIVPNWVNPQFFYPDDSMPELPAEWGGLEGGLPILHVGRKADEKNIETLIGALKVLPQQYIAIFVGQGDVSVYKLLAKRLGVEKRCFWIAKVDNDEMRKWYSWCHVMCTPSRWEGFGIVFIEASACGAPIVTSNIAPMNEILTHEHDALLVDDYESPTALAHAIERCSNKELSLRLSQNAVETSKKYYKEPVQALEARMMQTTEKRNDRPDLDVLRREQALAYFAMR
jgi:glycosyltransferase involved in cell wall biosynthesis